MTCTPAALADAAKCFVASLSAGQLDAIETYLSCQIANAGGGTGSLVQVYSGHYGGVAPGFSPAATAAIAYDLDTPVPYDEWKWDGTQWV